MTVYKCDRCGTVFESNPAEPIKITMEANRKVTIHIENPVPIKVKSNNDILAVDLCPDCLHDYCAFLSDPTTKIRTATSEVPKEPIENADETFDIVDAFMYLIWGRKVRRTTWAKDEYIRLIDDHLVSENGGLFPFDYLFEKPHIEARWEEYKEG